MNYLIQNTQTSIALQYYVGNMIRNVFKTLLFLFNDVFQSWKMYALLFYSYIVHILVQIGLYLKNDCTKPQIQKLL